VEPGDSRHRSCSAILAGALKGATAHDQADTRPADKAIFRILAIDGGGIRGVIPAVILQRLEALLAGALAAAPPSVVAKWKEREIAAPALADCFHLIAGTSTGGLLTTSLTVPDAHGRPKLSATDSVAVYETKGSAIFARPPLRRVLDPLGLLWPRYPLRQLRAVLEAEALLGKARLAEACTDVLLTCYDTTHTTPRLLTRWSVGARDTGPDPPSLSMVDAALATAAAPTYFDPEHAEGSYLVDGGMFAGNPVMEAITMALRRTEHPAPEDPSDLLVISIGTGSFEQPLDYGWGGVVGWLRPHKGGEALLEALLGGQGDSATQAAHMILNGWKPPAGGEWAGSSLPPEELGRGPLFWRYQPTLPEPWAMDDVSRVPALKQIALQAAGRYEQELRSLAEVLVAGGPVS
jgi:hypothetical protein